MNVNLGTDVTMPMIGFGTWPLRGSQAREATGYALRAGYRHLDTATMYANEPDIGRAVRDSAVPRAELFITTKLPASRTGQVRGTLEDSLRGLETDYVDLWLIHWPPSDRAAPELWSELIALRDEGLCRAIGVSNYSVAQLDELAAATGELPAVNQVPWSPRKHDAATLRAHRDRGVVLEGYSPLKNTRLEDPVLTSIAEAHGATAAQVVLRWHLEHQIPVIPKSATPRRIDENLAITGFELTPGEVAAIDAL